MKLLTLTIDPRGRYQFVAPSDGGALQADQLSVAGQALNATVIDAAAVRLTPSRAGDVVLRVELAAIGLIVAATGFACWAIFFGGT